MRRLLVLVFGLLVGSSFTPAASSQTASDDVQRTVLSNGLVLLTKVRPDPDSVAIVADRVMLRRLHELAEQRVSFAFETTLRVVRLRLGCVNSGRRDEEVGRLP